MSLGARAPRAAPGASGASPRALRRQAAAARAYGSYFLSLSDLVFLIPRPKVLVCLVFSTSLRMGTGEVFDVMTGALGSFPPAELRFLPLAFYALLKLERTRATLESYASVWVVSFIYTIV